MLTSNPSKLPPFSSLSHLLRTLSSIAVPSHNHISHLLLEQKSATQVLDTFQWASKLPSFTHSPSTYRALIHKLCTFRRFDIAHQLLDEMPHSIGLPPDDHIFVTLIHGLGRAHLVKQVIKVLDLVRKYNQRPSLKIFNSILDVLVKEDIDIAREFYRKKMVASGVKGDDYTFGILMKGLCLTNRIGDGFKLLQAIKSRGVAPNTVVYNTLLHALCRNGKVGRARSLMNEMEHPNDVTFNILISGYCGEENLVQALVMLEKCFGLGYVPDVVTTTKVLEILCNDGRVTEAVRVIERVESNGGLVDVVAYNTLIKGYCRLGKAKLGLRILKEIERKGCLPNVDTYNVLISGFCESGMLDKALDLFNDMKTDGINWNFATYDTLIRGLCSGGRTEDGLKILDLMNESKDGCRGRIGPFNSVLYGMYKEKRLDEALEFLANMGKLFPRAVDRSFRILGFCEEGATENAKKVYDQMTVERAVPCVLIYDYLIHRFCQQGCVRQAFELMNEMITHCYFPVSSTFNVLINGFCEQGKVGSALKLLNEMIGRGCLPDIESYSHLVGALCQKGDFQKALKLVLQMVGKGITPDYFTWNSLLLCSSRETVWLNSKSMFYVNNQLRCIIEA
ncbi:pentatricopeptide repeat-containing protein At2g17525, mitochondrial [Rosa rugosa]|uniref:pentatricopeptide repeat-containing protein At2g17525, mitochondrial n=1 Tax=Rosa rugosa TaxID=74645 RepID=UPI002B4114E6|nr:pentatricopeptide repeat-containing protein At2g17525, mitochondrial [Rosa rugosa]XP_061996010.1 pentatricopeptide repeat-containing protein At2g17525, mitochondrial [Rosa rugosa]XP_061996011.1 pentatricopeptide repeat-containing protein At2g17525, mitochondrial [Rosa rugosa]